MDEVDRDTDDIIAGYEVYRYGVPMLGVYVNGGRQSTVTISPAVPGTWYRIVAMALGHGRRSDIPAVASAFTATASECMQYSGDPPMQPVVLLNVSAFHSSHTSPDNAPNFI